jgi:hypothetical protein
MLLEGYLYLFRSPIEQSQANSNKRKESRKVESGRSLLALASPTHKRTERRFPVWSSEFTTKTAHYRRNSEGLAAGLKRNVCDLRAACQPSL